jgi:hypothetical protein
MKLPTADILRRGRRNQYSEARELFCYLAVTELGYSGGKVGAMIGMGSSSVTAQLFPTTKRKAARLLIVQQNTHNPATDP